MRTDLRSPPPDHSQSSRARIGRRVLTLIPGVRAASLGARRNPTFHFTIQPLQPFPGPCRTYTAEPGPFRASEIPPLPSLAIATGPNVPNPAPLEPNIQTRSAPVPGSPPHGPEPLMTHPSDRPGPGPGQTTYPRGLPPGVLGGFGHEHQMHGPHEGYQLGPTSMNLTLDTNQGPMVLAVELDLQQASRVADEKRKRNAGASARFRARRKEKEKEASHTISGLQQELRDLMGDRDFYLAERDYFRELAARHGSATQLLQRPPSPRHRRPARAPTSVAGSYAQLSSEESYREYHETGPSAQRRRTGGYQQPYMGSQTESPTLSAYSAGFPPQPPMSLPPPATHRRDHCLRDHLPRLSQDR
ncbi:hypothetical protein LTR80_011556 [Exophiala xenobiotica]